MEGIKVIHKPELLIDNLYFFASGSETTTQPYFWRNVTRIVYIHRRGVFENNISQFCKVYNL